MNTYRSQLLKFRRATYVPSRAQRLIVKSSMYEGEENREKLMHDFKLNLSKSFQECIITPKTFTQIVQKHWTNVGDVSLTVFLKDTQYHLDINIKDDTHNDDTLRESIDEVLYQLNAWQIGQYAINLIDAYGTLMDVDENKSVSIPLSVYVSRMDEFE